MKNVNKLNFFILSYLVILISCKPEKDHFSDYSTCCKMTAQSNGLKAEIIRYNNPALSENIFYIESCDCIIISNEDTMRVISNAFNYNKGGNIQSGSFDEYFLRHGITPVSIKKYNDYYLDNLCKLTTNLNKDLAEKIYQDMVNDCL